MHRTLSALPLVLLSAACAAPAQSVHPSPPNATPTVAAKTAFDTALAKFVAHDAAKDWTDASCRESAASFEAIATGPALFDASLAYERCALDGDAMRVLEKSVAESKFQDVGALVGLATLQMKKNPQNPEAKLNLQRALAIDDANMPAYNQLALFYLGTKRLELGALVCAQATKKNAAYAPLHNTLALIENELGRVNAAVAEFATAMKLDPNFFEAHMNYASVNLGFRGFDQARTALARAIEIRPNDYDAHLGMALALRGPITGAEADLGARIAAVQAELDAAKRIDPNRPDAYYNEAILVQEFTTKTAPDAAKTKVVLDQAERTFKTFLGKAAGKARYDVAVKRANDRLADIDAMRAFL